MLQIERINLMPVLVIQVLFQRKCEETAANLDLESITLFG